MKTFINVCRTWKELNALRYCNVNLYFILNLKDGIDH